MVLVCEFPAGRTGSWRVQSFRPLHSRGHWQPRLYNTHNDCRQRGVYGTVMCPNLPSWWELDSGDHSLLRKLRHSSNPLSPLSVPAHSCRSQCRVTFSASISKRICRQLYKSNQHALGGKVDASAVQGAVCHKTMPLNCSLGPPRWPIECGGSPQLTPGSGSPPGSRRACRPSARQHASAGPALQGVAARRLPDGR